jgi:hypothetical protein
LEKSVKGALLLNLHGRAYDEAIDQPWQYVIGSVPPLVVGEETAVAAKNGPLSGKYAVRRW